jgi:hypothetical protein
MASLQFGGPCYIYSYSKYLATPDTGDIGVGIRSASAFPFVPSPGSQDLLGDRSRI